MTDTLKSRRTRPAKLGMTVTKPKADPYANLSKFTESGTTEEERLELAGRKRVPRAAARSQKRLPKVKPYGGKGDGRA